MEGVSGSSGMPGDNKAQRPFIQGQTIISVVNDPRADKGGGWWGIGRGDLNAPWAQAPPPLDPQKYPHYTRRDLGDYLRIVHTLHQQFLHERESLAETANRQLLLGDTGPEADQQQQAAALKAVAAQGDGLAKALQRVPAQFFQEDFSIERSGLLQAQGDGGSLDDLMERIDTLTQYLDVVETQMAREIATRSKAVSSAAQHVGVLHQQLCAALGNARVLRAHLAQADAHTYGSTCRVMALQRRRRNIDATLEALQALEEVHSSRAALQLLLDGQDYAGALDLLEVVVYNMEATAAQGVTAFAPILPEMRDTRELLESLLACEFVGLANFDGANVALDGAVAYICVLGPGMAPTPADVAALLRGNRSSGKARLMGLQDAVGEGQGGLLQEQQSSGLSSEEVVGGGAEAASVAREQLHDKLLPVVLALLRVDRLSGAMHQLRENVGNATKGLIAEALERCLGPTGPPHLQQPGGAASQGMLQDLDGQLLGPQPSVDPATGAPAAVGPAGGREGTGGATPSGPGAGQAGSSREQQLDGAMAAALERVGHDGFMQILLVIHTVVAAFVQHCGQLAAIIKNDILPAARVPGPTAAAVAHDAAAITQALAEAAQTRWVRLLNTRSALTNRLKLYEFQVLADACEAFAQLLEPLSHRAALGVRSAVQAQGRGFLDALHARNVAQLQHLLEAEQWSMAEVPAQFQAIVDKLIARSAPPAIPGLPHHSRSSSASILSTEQNGGSSEHGSPTKQGHGHNHSHSQGQLQSPAGKAHGQGHGRSGSRGDHHTPGMLHVQGKAFPLVTTTLMSLKLLDEYLVLADNSPMFVLEVGHYVCDLIKVFNAQACQLVLGAGAVRSAGLKSISAKHLALSCESCYMLARLLPSLRAALLGPTGVVTSSASLEPRKRMLHVEFDKVAADLSSHTSEIHSKLVDIMQDRLVAAARQLTQDAAKWGVPPVQHDADFMPSVALANLHKQLTTLHTVLGPLLQQEEVHYIFGRVASLYSEALAATFDALQHPKLAPPASTMPQQPSNPLARGLGSVRAGPGAGVLPQVSISVTVRPEELAAWEDVRRRNAVYALGLRDI